MALDDVDTARFAGVLETKWAPWALPLTFNVLRDDAATAPGWCGGVSLRSS